MEYRKAGSRDVDRFVENRMEFVASIRNLENVSDFKKITLSCTEEGFALYQKLGFNISENQMELKL